MKRSVVFQTQYNTFYDEGEVNDEPSMTTPDMALSMGEIMTRFNQGRPLNIRSRNQTFTGDTELPNVAAMSEMDSIDMVEALKVHQRDLEAQLAEQKQKRADRRNALRKQKEAKQASTTAAQPAVGDQPK